MSSDNEQNEANQQQNENISISPQHLQNIITSSIQAALAATQANQHQQNNASAIRGQKPTRPTISHDITNEQWSHFKSKWVRYKTILELGPQEIINQLLESCDDDLQLSLHRAIGPSTSLMTENELLKTISEYAVKAENILVNRLELTEMRQNHDEETKHFVTRLQGRAKSCDYNVTCPNCLNSISYSEQAIIDQLCKGLIDVDIQQQLLSQYSKNMTLSNALKYVSEKEAGKRCHTQLSSNVTASKISPYQQSRRNDLNKKPAIYETQVTAGTDSRPCDWCGKVGHGKKAGTEIRRKICPAFGKICSKCQKPGHFQSVCRSKQYGNRNTSAYLEPSASEADHENPIFLGSVEPCPSNEIAINSLNVECIPHMEYDSVDGWKCNKSKEDPIINIDIHTCYEPYKHLRVKYPPSKTVTIPAIADTGARTTVAGRSLLDALGLTINDLFPVKQKLCGANNSSLNILGGLFISINPTKEKSVQTHVLCYIQQDNPGKLYLSRTACEKLGLITESFPSINATLISDTNSSEEVVNCTCPVRSKPPQPPSDLPFPPIEENREKLEQWLLQYYSSSTFNICEHQPLPKMSGPPLHLIVNEGAIPQAIHTPIPIPIHWQKAVKSSLDRDVRLGVIEPVPWGTPTTWCSRMVVVPKKDGTPRRTVDLQPLNAVSPRQTHHTPSPFHQAASVPNNMRKTVCDAWNGYHSIPIRNEDRHLTQFITPWGRYQYRTAPQGYLAAGDAYTRRYDEIINDIPNKTKCVDDTLIWAPDITDIFHRTCEFLTRCGENGITLNPKKFQFGKTEVEFAGFIITNTSVRPSNKYLEAITNFPTPTDITGIRSWFGLVNQVAYALSLTHDMAPFRELLKPGNKFYWDEQLQKLFDDSKKSIITKVQDGVRIFDSSKSTCLITDWSKTGTGFCLLQKHCSCTETSPKCCHDGWHLVFAGSKFNSPTESNYAPIEGECLAIVKALHKARHFVLGCSDLIIATDHKPLLKILGDRDLEKICNPRLLKLKEKTLRYRFKIIHIPGSINSGADATSRYPTGIRPCSNSNTSPISLDADNYSYGLAIGSLSYIDHLKTVTWNKVQEETLNDVSMLNLLNIIQEGFPDEASAMPSNIRQFHKFRNELSTIDAVIIYKNRIVIPPSLRQTILENLHSAHQGVTSMTSRADSSVFWPGINPDIQRIRDQCTSCNRMAPSQPNPPPTPLTHPQYPFQYICADYFQYKGINYLVIVDRYSNWPTILKVRDGEGSKQLVGALKTFCETFGIPDELASDGGPQFIASETQKFLKDWGIHHRLSSVAYPHSNCRAELGVKTCKRLLTNNVGSQGALNTDSFRRALLQYKNTPDPDSKQSPARIVFGREIRDFTPTIPNNYHPAQVWTLTSEQRETALAKRHFRDAERLVEHTYRLPPLRVGDHVYIQNQTGNEPRKWNKSGIIIEVKQFDQYSVKIDGSGRITIRNRKFLRKFTPYNPLLYNTTTNFTPMQQVRNNQCSQLAEQNTPSTPPRPNTQPTTPLSAPPITPPSTLPMTHPGASPTTPSAPPMTPPRAPPMTPPKTSPTTPQTSVPHAPPAVLLNEAPSTFAEHTSLPPLRRSTRIRKPNRKYEDYQMNIVHHY